MATKHTDTCLQKAGDDEPIFVLRAQDELAPMVVLYWARLAEEHGAASTKIPEALDLADRMVAWSKKNNSKLPD